MIDGNIEVSLATPYYHTDVLSNDLVIFASSNSQHIVIGTTSNQLSIINMSTSNIKLNTPTYIGAVQPYAPQGAQVEIADAGSNNQFMLYNNSNNRKGLYMNSKYNVARIAGYDWTFNNPLHMTLQDAGSNLGIGMGMSNPLGLLHLRNNTTSNNIIFESGRVSDGTSEGLSAINFNGYTTVTNNRITTNKNRWRLYVDQRSTNEFMNIDAYNGTTTYNYVTLSNNNIGFNKPNPISRVHILASTVAGTTDMTNSSNAPITLEDNSGNAMRVLHINTHATDSTINNYQTNKNVYWGETTDLGMYYFRGRFVAIQSNLGIGTTNPTTLLQMSSNSFNYVKYTSASNTSGFWVGLDDTSTLNGIGSFVWNSSNAHIKFGTNNTERMRLLSNGKLILGSVDPLAQVGAMYEIADGGSNNQFVLYNNSNNRYGLYMNTSNSMIRIAGYDWTNSRAVHMMLQDAGCNLSIGQGNSAPVSLVHIRNNTTSNNLLIEAGRASDGTSEGFSAINFNGYFQSGDRRITTAKNRWRLLVDQRSTSEYMSFDSFNGATNYSYMLLSNQNVGINKINPVGRLHVIGSAIVGGSDGTGTSNNSLTLEDSGGSVRVVYLSSHVSSSTIYNYQTAKSVYWGELGDTGMYYFRGRHVAISSNLGINTTNPTQRLEVNGNMMFTTTASLFAGNTLTIQPNVGNLIFNTNTASTSTIFQIAGVEKARFTGTGSLSIGSNNADVGVALYAFSNMAGRFYTKVENSNSGTSSYVAQGITNNNGGTCWWWLNSTTRTSDGPASCATLRNDAGDLRLAAAGTSPYIYLQASTGRVGINTVSPAYTLDISGSVNLNGQINMAVNTWHTSADAKNRIYFLNASSTIFGSANAYVWRSPTDTQDNMTLTSTGNLSVIGSFSAASKSFCIPHPLAPEEKALVHACVEAPRHDLMYSGKAILINGKAIIQIDLESCPDSPMDTGTFDALTKNVRIYLQNNESFDRVKGKVISGVLTIECENPLSNVVIDWLIIAERCDSSLKLGQYSNSNGTLITTWKKDDVLIPHSNRPSNIVI